MPLFIEGTSLKGKNLLPEQFLMSWKLILPHKVISLECYYFITQVRICVMGATPIPAHEANVLYRIHVSSFVCCQVRSSRAHTNSNCSSARYATMANDRLVTTLHSLYIRSIIDNSASFTFICTDLEGGGAEGPDPLLKKQSQRVS